MRNISAQLFEYLLAARNSNLPINYDLNSYSTYWFLDEILSSIDNRLVENEVDKTTFIEITRPVLKAKEVEVSLVLHAVFKLLQYEHTSDDILNVTSEELKEILSLEYESLKQKISSKDKDLIILNDWQQLLLGETAPKIRIDLAISKFDQSKDLIQEIVSEYIAWKRTKEQVNDEQKPVIRAQALYDYLVNFDLNSKTKQQLHLGIGILNVPGEPSIYHPVLSLKINIDTDHSEGVCRLCLSQSSLNVDAILDHVLFYDLDTVEDLRNHIKKSKLTAFDDESIADILKKMIKLIHPNGKYFTSPVEATGIDDDAPQLLHRSVLFFRQDKEDLLSERLKKTADNLKNNCKPSDVLGSIVDPNYLTTHHYDSKFLQVEHDQYLFPMATTDAEESILRLLNEEAAVTVFEEDKINKFHIISNLITHLIGSGKRILVLAENLDEMDEARKFLPSYLNGLHTVVSNKAHSINLMKESLQDLLAGKEKNKNLAQVRSKIIESIQEAMVRSDEIKKQIIDYRELSSKKFVWKDKRYLPYELAQLVSKLGGYEHLTGDIIPISAKFELKNSDIKELWELKSYFTPENMDLLNYDFIDVDQLLNFNEYQNLLVAEEKYLRLCSEHGDLESMFEDETDISFVQYLLDKLPKLSKDVSEIKDPYGEMILKEAMVSLDNYHSLATSVDCINRGIKDIQNLDGSDHQRDTLINKLNTMLHIQRSEMPIISSDSEGIKILHQFYVNKKTNMTKALRTAHLIWIFNEEAFALSKNFKGISAEGIDIMNILYHAAAIHLSKVEVKIGWSRVRSHFIKMYQPLIQQEQIHPLCLDLYESLKHNSFSDFKAVLRELNDKIATRHKFTIFGNFISEISRLMPNFTTKVMADIEGEIDTIPDFKAAFEQGKLNALFEQLQRYASKVLEQKNEYFESYKLELQHELIKNECWKDKSLSDKKDVLELIELLDESSLNNSNYLRRYFSSFSTVFIPLNADSILEKIDTDQFDIVIFLDASSSTVFRLPDLMHANKSILFGNSQEAAKEVVSLTNLRKLTTKYGQTLHNFGEQYLSLSLFDLVAHSAAWDARVKPNQSVPLIKGLDLNGKKGVKKCDNVVEEEIFEELMKFGYDIKCKVKVGSLLLDFLIEGKDNSLAVNVIGDSQMHREMIKKQLDQEIALKNQGLDIYTIVAPNYYLDPRKTLLTIYKKLDELNIYPVK